jgi:hypothetical protein
MALAKYYEDIMGRLLEEVDRFEAAPLSEHLTLDYDLRIQAHLRTSRKVLNEIIDLLKTPEHAQTLEKAQAVYAGILDKALASRDDAIAVLRTENHTLVRAAAFNAQLESQMNAQIKALRTSLAETQAREARLAKDCAVYKGLLR